MIPAPLYIGFPAISGLILLIVFTAIVKGTKQKDPQIVWSLRVGWLHCAFAFGAVYLTTQNPIDMLSCMTGVFGYFISIAVGGADAINLLVWLVRKIRAKTAWAVPLLLVVLRLAVHAALISAFAWCALLCTV